MDDKSYIALELDLEAKLESLLFVAPSSVSIHQLAEAIAVTPREVENSLKSLKERLLLRGIRLQRHRGRIQLITAPETAEIVERFLNLEATSRLSRAALESLSIIAYQQPVTRPQIDAIRGVNSDSVLRSLLSKGLVQEVGRAGTPGRPIIYSTTLEFLQHFGLTSLDELPPLNLEDEIDDLPLDVEIAEED